MLEGKSLQELAREVERVENEKKDFLANTTALSMGVREDDKPIIELAISGQGFYGINPIAHDQISDRLGIPRGYYNRMKKDHPELLAENVNHWLEKEPSRRMVRTLDGSVRAVLSDKYRPLDNYPVLGAALPVLAEHKDLTIKSCDLTERRLYIQAVSERLQGEVKVGDVVQGGLILSNSEIGLGMVKVEALAYRLVCKNGAIVGDSMRRRHVGRRIGNGEDFDVHEFYQEDTIEADVKAFMLKVRDTVINILSEETFAALLDKMRATTERKIRPNMVTATVENVTKNYGLLKDEGEGVLGHLIQGGDLSQWGLANAVTALAHTSPNYDRSVEVERIGGRIIDLQPNEWKVIAG